MTAQKRFHFDIGHPAHVHYFKHVIRKLKRDGHQVFVSARRRYPVFELLESEGIGYYDRGTGSQSLIGKLLSIPMIDLKLLILCLKQRPDVLIAFGAPYISHVARLLGKTSIMIDDTDNARINHLFYSHTASMILTPSVFRKDFGKKHQKFNGYMELSYLHRKYFVPNPDVLQDTGIEPGQRYTIMRFVAWNANHDTGHSGMSMENKRKAVQEFLKFGPVYIFSESPLPDDLAEYQLTIHPSQIHHLMAHASLLYGESATMASESACLGVPAIFVDNEGRSYTDELENKYHIVFNFKEDERGQQASIQKSIEVLKTDQTQLFKEIAERIQDEKICFTDLLHAQLQSLST